jgi:DNA-binding GntR family transcriptional regulator
MANETIRTRGGSPQTISAWLADSLRRKILDGEFEAGERIRQDAIAALYGVSTTPVREAFLRLYSEGLLVAAPHKGAIVFVPTVGDLEEIYAIRLMLEPAATRAAVPNLTSDDLELLKATVEQMQQLTVEESDAAREQAQALNSAFHRTIYAAAHMPRLSAIIGQLQDSSQVYIRIFSLTVRRGSEDPEERMGIAEHEAIYLACAARAPEAAAQATVVHLQHTLEVVRRELRSQRTAGLPAAVDSP